MILREGTSWIPEPGNAAGPGGGALPQLDKGALKRGGLRQIDICRQVPLLVNF